MAIAQSLSIIWEALTLNTQLYDDAHEDEHAVRLGQGIVWAAAVSHGIGSALILLISRPSLWQLIVGWAVNTLAVAAGYYGWTYSIWQIGRRLRPWVPSFRELLAPTGLAYTPQLLNILTVIPLFGRPIGLALGGWSLLAIVVAVRYGLNISQRKAMLIALLGFPIVQLSTGLIQIMVQRWFQ